MDVSISRQEPFYIVTLRGALDAVSAPELDEALAETLQSPDCVHMIVDMDSVEYVSSAGLRSVLGIAKNLRKKQGQLRFTGLCPMTKQVFDIAGFTAYFKEFPTVQEALSAGL